MQPEKIISLRSMFFFLNLLLFSTCQRNDIPSLFPVPTQMPVTEKSTYKVVYNGNGASHGSLPGDDNSYKTGDSVTIPGAGGMFREGYLFTGWNTEEKGTGTTYLEGGILEMPDHDVILYAQWECLVENPDHLVMVNIPGGTYHQVGIDFYNNTMDFLHTLSDFKIGKYEVTYELWHKVKSWGEENHYFFANSGREGNDGVPGAAPTVSGKEEPVTGVIWRDCIVWCNAYSEMMGYKALYCMDREMIKPHKRSINKGFRYPSAGSIDNPYVDWRGNGYRLPTEGEWQYAASYQDGMSWTPWKYASGASGDCYNESATGAVAVHANNSGRQTSPVGGKLPNQPGIYDMSGNVIEWCWDIYQANIGSGDKMDYRGGVTDFPLRLGKGGGWAGSVEGLRIGYRFVFDIDQSADYLGFRLIKRE